MADTSAISTLKAFAPSIIDRLFTPGRLVQAGYGVEASHEARRMFDAAVVSYRSRRYEEAIRIFLEAEGIAESVRKDFGRTARINAAAGYAALGRFERVIELLQPTFVTRKLYGVPLWNLALANYRTGNPSDSMQCLDLWISRAPEHLRATGYLIAAAVVILSDDVDRASDYLQSALRANKWFVMRQLPSDLPQNQAGVARTIHTSGMAYDLERLLSPKRPDRSPLLAAFLARDEMERFAAAVEALAEGESDNAGKELEQLRERHPGAALLDMAVASADLFRGNASRAQDVLLRIEDSGMRLPGGGSWNLACAQVRLKDFDGALRSLRSCAETEYRTKPELWAAMKLLTGAEYSSPRPLPTRQTTQLVEKLPADPQECRLELLRRIIVPRLMSRNYRPDLARLPERHRRAADSLLDAAFRASAAEASTMLAPLAEEHKDVYTIVANAAAFAIMAGDLARGASLLRHARELRQLDAVSAMNLAFLHLTAGDMSGVLTALSMGESTTLSEKPFYWLAVAICRALAGNADAGFAAARAVRGTTETSRVISQALRAAAISPAQVDTVGNTAVLTARAAIERIDKGDIEAAVSILSTVAGPSLEEIPEIGPRVLEPQLVPRPSTTWGKESSKHFIAAVKRFQEGRFGEAAAEFSDIYKKLRRPGIVLNITAARLKAGEPKKARTLAGKAMREHRGLREWHWRLVYNFALACVQVNDLKTAVQVMKRSAATNLLPLRVAVSGSESKGPALRTEMASALNQLRKSVNPPSQELLIALAWALLTQPTPDVQAGRSVLTEVAKESSAPVIASPAEVTSTKQVHAAYRELANRPEEAEAYLQTVIDTHVRAREYSAGAGSVPAQIEHAIAVELAARYYLITTLLGQNKRVQAIQVLEESENILQDYSSTMPVGFVAKDWFDLATVAESLGLNWTALRYCRSGLAADAEDRRLQELHSKLDIVATVGESGAVVEACRALSGSINDTSSDEQLTRIKHGLGLADVLRKRAPSLIETLTSALPASGGAVDPKDASDLVDRLTTLARMELPSEAAVELDAIFEWLSRVTGAEERKIQLDIETYDGKVWPRSDEREGCCLLVLATVRDDASVLHLTDPSTGTDVWHGSVKPGQPEYVRWIVERDDGFVPDELLDVSLTVESITGPARVVTQHPVDLLVAPTEPRWPNYPTGALSPDDTSGRELYGRAALIRKLLSTLGPTRSQATYLIEAPRQMGKTSLLNFVRKQVPDHVLAVYVNLELPWSRLEPENVWSYLAHRILIESGQEPKPSSGREPQDLVDVAAEACEKLQKKYVVLLLDDFHSVLERAKDPRSVLAVLRDFHNNSSSRISLLIADRYTREELEGRCPSEYWAQLTILPLGPLDRAGTQSAITAPAQDSDVVYLAETIERLYHWTAGYPYHLQRAAQYMLDAMWSGPWLTAIPSDVDAVVPRMLAEDNLFQAGLCRPDRIDSTAEQAIAALLEWSDLVAFLPTISTEPEWAEMLTSWQPRPADLLADIGDAPSLLRHLAAIGVVLETSGQYELFSPLLVSWLREMRRQGRSLRGSGKGSSWGVLLGDDAASLSGADWQRLDSELIQRCRDAKAKSPLKERATSPDDWNTLAREAGSHLEFKQFLSVLFRLFIDGREEKDAMLTYPWLTLAYHRCRLVRNYFEHSGGTPSRVAVLAWDQVCSRALGKECHSYTPATSEEWRTIQVSMLRVLYSGLRNAIALVGSRHLGSAVEPVS